MKNRILKLFVGICIFSSLQSNSQTTSVECQDNTRRLIDSVFVSNFGTKQFNSIKDSLSIWFKLKLSRSGKVIKCEVYNAICSKQEWEFKIIDFLTFSTLQCLYKFYSKDNDAEFININFPYTPLVSESILIKYPTR